MSSTSGTIRDTVRETTRDAKDAVRESGKAASAASGDIQADLEALRAGIELGMTHIDTAEMYMGSEEVVAQAIHGRRRNVFLVSKVLPSNASYRATIRACDASLRRLKTD